MLPCTGQVQMKFLPSPSIWKCRWRLLVASLRGLLLHQPLHAFSYHCRCLSIRFGMWHLGFRCPSRTRSKHNRCRLRLMLWHTHKVLPVTPVPQLHTRTATSPTLPKGWSTLQRVHWVLMHLRVRPRPPVVQAAKVVAEGGEAVAARATDPDTCVAKAEKQARAAEAAAGRTDPVDGQSPPAVIGCAPVKRQVPTVGAGGRGCAYVIPTWLVGLGGEARPRRACAVSKTTGVKNGRGRRHGTPAISHICPARKPRHEDASVARNAARSAPPRDRRGNRRALELGSLAASELFYRFTGYTNRDQSARRPPRPVPRCATGRGLEGRGALGCAVYARCAGRNNAYTRRCVSGNVSRSQRASRAGRVAPTGGSLAIGSTPALSSLRRPARPRKHRAIRPNRFSIRHKARPGIRWLSLRTPSDRIQTRSSIQRDSMRDLCVAETLLRACGTGRAWAAASLTLLRSTIAAIHVYRQLPRRKRTQHGHVGHMHLIIVHLFARGFYPLTFLKGAISHS